MIFGKKGCDEQRDWKVRIYLVDKERLTVGEQLTRKNAMEMFKAIKEKIKDKETFIEVETELGYTYLLMKLNIVDVDMYRY